MRWGGVLRVLTGAVATSIRWVFWAALGVSPGRHRERWQLDHRAVEALVHEHAAPQPPSASPEITGSVEKIQY